MRDEAERRISKLYPKATVWRHLATGAIYTEDEQANILANTITLLDTKPSLLPHASDLEKQELTVIAWLWARIVKCPNPACAMQMPLVRSFWLSSKKGKEVWIEPQFDASLRKLKFVVNTGSPSDSQRKINEIGTCVATDKDEHGVLLKKVKKAKATFRCCICNAGVAKGDYIDNEANAGRMDVLPMAMVVEAKGGRLYLPVTADQHQIARKAVNDYVTDHGLSDLFPNQPAKGTFASNAQGRVYGFKTFADYFTMRQLVAITTFCDLASEVRSRVLNDSNDAGYDIQRAKAYMDAIATYLCFAVDKAIDRNTSLCSWEAPMGRMRNTFGRQGIAMVWDFTETNPFAGAGGDILGTVMSLSEALDNVPANVIGVAEQANAEYSPLDHKGSVISTDPPYYDNISYADLSDFFYVWLRRALGEIYPNLFRTMLVPKAEELIASPYRFNGSKENARQFFESGLHRVFQSIRIATHPDYPVTIYYAFKQSEGEVEDDVESSAASPLVASTGWETFLQSLIDARMQITATWPMRTELGNRMVGAGTNALASSIVLACRCRPDDAPTASRRDFVNALRRELADALRAMMRANVAPVDLAQATIGPGMAVYSRYAQILEADGKPLRVRTALQIINAELDTVLAEQEGDYDSDTRFCLAWFEQFSMNAAAFGEADVLARAKGTSVAGLVEGGVLEAKAGKVRLLKRDEMPIDWVPQEDNRRSVWETCQHLIKALYDGGSEVKAARLMSDLGGDAEVARDLAYRLYIICERKGWSSEALAYNSLVLTWSEVAKLSANLPSGATQTKMEL